MSKKKPKHFREYKLEIYHGLILDKAEEVGAKAWAIYTFIAMFANWETGECYPAQEKLMRLAKIKNHSTFVQCIEKLKEAGLLTYEIRKPRNNEGIEYGRLRYFYKLTWPANKKYIKPE